MSRVIDYDYIVTAVKHATSLVDNSSYFDVALLQANPELLVNDFWKLDELCSRSSQSYDADLSHDALDILEQVMRGYDASGLSDNEMCGYIVLAMCKDMVDANLQIDNEFVDCLHSVSTITDDNADWFVDHRLSSNESRVRQGQLLLKSLPTAFDHEVSGRPSYLDKSTSFDDLDLAFVRASSDYQDRFSGFCVNRNCHDLKIFGSKMGTVDTLQYSGKSVADRLSDTDFLANSVVIVADVDGLHAIDSDLRSLVVTPLSTLNGDAPYYYTPVELSNCSFDRASLEGCIFSKAKLNSSVFHGANMSGAAFRSCHLDNIVFDCDLNASTFVSTYYGRISFAGANLSNSTFVVFRRSDDAATNTYRDHFLECDLTNSWFDFCSFPNFNYEKCDMSNSYLSDCNFDSNVFSDVNLSNCVFDGVRFDHVNFSSCNLDGVHFNSCIGLDTCTFDRASVKGAYVKDSNGQTRPLSSIVTSYTDDYDSHSLFSYSGGRLHGWEFSDRDMAGEFFNVKMISCSFSDVSMGASDFYCVKFSNVVFSDVTFDPDASHTFEACDFTGTRFIDCHGLDSCKFTRCTGLFDSIFDNCDGFEDAVFVDCDGIANSMDKIDMTIDYDGFSAFEHSEGVANDIEDAHSAVPDDVIIDSESHADTKISRTADTDIDY